MAIAHVVSGAAGSTGASTGATTAGLDTTGADALVLAASYFTGGSGVTISDSNANVWTALTAYQAGGIAANSYSRLYYSLSPIVGTGHTFSISGTSIFGAIAVSAFSGVDAYSAETGSSAQAAGSLTPSADGALVVGGLSFSKESGDDPTVASPLTRAAYANGVSSQTFGSAIGYVIQTTATAVNPTWTVTDASIGTAASAAVFLPPASPPPPAAGNYVPLLTGLGW